MFLEGLDELDQKIVQLLIQNARMSYSELGEKTGISRVAVKMRVQALEQRGVIEQYTAIVNPQKLSGAVSCYFELKRPRACWPVWPRLCVQTTPSPKFTVLRVTTSCMCTPWRPAPKRWRR